jgi:HEAT repeats
MAISVTCGGCAEAYRVRDDAAGKTFKCKSCGETIDVPAARSRASASATKDPWDEEAPELPRATVSASRKKKSARRSGMSDGAKRALWVLGLLAGGGVALVVVGVAIVFGIRALGRLAPEVAWRDFSPPDNRYTISIPGEPKFQTKTVSGVVMSLYSVETANYSYITVHLVPPPGTYSSQPTEALLDNMRTGAIQAMPGARLVSEKGISYEKTPGREFHLESNEIAGTMRIYLGRDMAFMLQVMHKKARPIPQEDIQRFFNSFVLRDAGAPDASPATPGGTFGPNAAGGPNMAGRRPGVMPGPGPGIPNRGMPNAGSLTPGVPGIPGAGGVPGAPGAPETPDANAKKQSAEELAADLESGDYFKLNLSLSSLASMEPQEPRARVVKAVEQAFLNAKNPGAQIKAMQVLEKWATPEAVPTLTGALDNSSSFVRGSALVALGRLRAAKAAPEIAKRLSDLSDRQAAANALIAIGSEAEPDVLNQLNTNDVFIAAEICRILEEIGTKASISTLKKIIANDQNFLVTSAANRALIAINKRR